MLKYHCMLNEIQAYPNTIYNINTPFFRWNSIRKHVQQKCLLFNQSQQIVNIDSNIFGECTRNIISVKPDTDKDMFSFFLCVYHIMYNEYYHDTYILGKFFLKHDQHDLIHTFLWGLNPHLRNYVIHRCTKL